MIILSMLQGDGGAVVALEGGGDILGSKRTSYQDYVDLWLHVMDPTKLKVGC